MEVCFQNQARGLDVGQEGDNNSDRWFECCVSHKFPCVDEVNDAKSKAEDHSSMT